MATAERLARNFQEVSLTVDTLTGGEKLTQALYLTFKNNKEIRRLNELLVAHIFNSSDYELHPHLSLLYQNLKTKERKALIEDIKLDIKSILFNELRVVAIPEQLKSIDDLKGWQTLLSCRLAPGENLDTL